MHVLPYSKLPETGVHLSLADGGALIGRLKLRSPYRGHTTRVNSKITTPSSRYRRSCANRTPAARSRAQDVDVSFDELETLVRNDRTDWKAALASVKGVYLIDTKTGGRYVGSRYGERGI